MNLKRATMLLQLISDESRLTIIMELQKQKRMTGFQLLKYIDCGQSTLSHHMALLVGSEMVKSKKKGNKVFYSLNNDLFSSLINYLSKDVSKNINDFIIEKNELLEQVFDDNDKDEKIDEVPIYLL